MSEKKVISVTEINESEFSCKAKNLTMLKVNKTWLTSALESNHIEEVLNHLARKVFALDTAYYQNQKIVAFINLVKDVRKTLKDDKQIEYKLNLVVRNLNTHKEDEKNAKLGLVSKNRLMAILSLIFIVFNPSFAGTVKKVLVKKEK